MKRQSSVRRVFPCEATEGRTGWCRWLPLFATSRKGLKIKALDYDITAIRIFVKILSLNGGKEDTCTQTDRQTDSTSMLSLSTLL